MSSPIFRFAPSPNGYLHLGHAFSALINQDMARAAGGRLLLRIEDIDRARGETGALDWTETGRGPADETGTIAAAPQAWGDVVLGRKEMPTSYHLAVVIDDALQGVTHVVRGQDLFGSTGVHRLLQALLGL